MKRFLIITGFIVLFVGAGLMTLFVKTTTANADIAAGNQAYAAKNYDAALQRYTAAQSQAPGQVEPAYDAANTYYRQNELEKAQQTLEPTRSHAPQALAEFVHFNLGNIAYNAKQLDVAIAQYEDALRLQPNDRDAKYNLELALQQKQQQDQQNQQQQNQQNQQQQNQQNQQQNQQNQDQQQQNQNQQNQQNQSGGQQDQQQKQQDQQNGQQGDRQQQQQDQQNGQQGDQQKQNQNQQDQQNGQQGDQQNQQQPNQQQGQSAGQPDPQQRDQQNGQAVGAPQQKGLTPEQAKRLLAVIGGNSKTLMEKLQLMYMASGSYPDQDW